MTETLGQKRCRFTTLFGHLQDYGRSLGYGVAVDEVRRSVTEAEHNAALKTGIVHSLHILGLAGDLLLYQNGVYLEKTEDYAKLGEYWETLAPDARWGGRFHPRPDGDHFSLEHNGVK